MGWHSSKLIGKKLDPTLTLPLPGEGTDITLQKIGSKVPPPGKGEARRGSSFHSNTNNLVSATALTCGKARFANAITLSAVAR
jgi:hypothetical protein